MQPPRGYRPVGGDGMEWITLLKTLGLLWKNWDQALLLEMLLSKFFLIAYDDWDFSKIWD